MKHFLPAIVLSAVGIVVLNWTLSTISTIKDSAGWSPVDGAVYYSQVRKRMSSRPHTSTGDRYEVSYDAEIRYRYRVGRRQYESNDFVYNTMHSFTREDEARMEVAAYPVGRTVRVFYNPDNPQQACLRPGKVPFGLYLAALLGSIFIIGGAVLFIAGVRSVSRATVAEVDRA